MSSLVRVDLGNMYFEKALVDYYYFSLGRADQDSDYIIPDIIWGARDLRARQAPFLGYVYFVYSLWRIRVTQKEEALCVNIRHFQVLK